ncbi:MAG: hypothetical protein FJY20_11110 [Bacteroidetes bacterium]|nr:hypothetical protein [Bacteroidota bacterium]
MKIIFLTVLLAVSGNIKAQTTGTGLGSGSVTTQRMEVYSWAQRPDEDGTNLQKKFIKQEWTPGIVKFRSGRPDMHVPMIFDIFNNMLYYLQDSIIMEFVDSVSQITFLANFNKDTVLMIFRRFYPSVQTNTSATFYRVLVDAKLTLLKCEAKSIMLFKDPATPEEKKKDPPHHLYFAYMPSGDIVLIEPNTEKLMAAMPECRNLISDITKRAKLKVKDERRMIELFVHLNNAMQ